METDYPLYLRWEVQVTAAEDAADDDESMFFTFLGIKATVWITDFRKVWKVKVPDSAP